MGVWIETPYKRKGRYTPQVTPCMGVWIETECGDDYIYSDTGHTLYGCVD